MRLALSPLARRCIAVRCEVRHAPQHRSGFCAVAAAITRE